MDRSALSSASRLLLATAAAVFLSLAATPSNAQPDPPAQAGRLSYISGNVSVQVQGSDDWAQAIPNLPLGPGDRVFTDSDGRAEIQVGRTFLRVGRNSDVTLIDSTPEGIYFGLAQGSAHIHAGGLWEGQSVYINTPSGSATLSYAPEGLRVDVLPEEQATVFSSFDGNVMLTGAGGFEQYIGPQQALELVGSNPVVPQWMQAANWDALDEWSKQREQEIAQAVSYQYVSPEIPGANELDAAGTWMPGSPYGPVWFPNNVSGDWAPYHNGHWINHAPWGWVWVEDESWGYAPFHYGRWVSYEGRWGWVPGSPERHPVWSPALVVFAGGIHVGGVGVSAWFPLGPGEAYHPWYHCSPHYVDDVNISNIRESPRVHVQNTYVNINITNVTYVNRTIAVTAMNTTDFAAGRRVHEAPVVVDTRQMEHVQVMAAPEAVAPTHPFIGQRPARPVPVSASRPVLINEHGMAMAAKPGAQPMAPPVKAVPVIRPVPGRMVVAPPANAGKPMPPANRPPTPGTPEFHPAPAAGAPVRPEPMAPPKPAPPAPSNPQVNRPAQPPVENRPAVPSPAAPSKPAPPQPESKPVTPAPARSVISPTPQPQAKTPPPPAEKPAAPPAPAATKPGTTPPAKTDKPKDKTKEQPKDENKDKPNGM